MIRASKHHLAEIGESYRGHLRAALEIAVLLGRAGFACALHALIPGLCTRTASRCLAQVELILQRRDAAARIASHGAPEGPLPASGDGAV